MGERVIANLKAVAPERRVTAVGPSASGIAGVETSATLRDLGHTPDAVVIAVRTNRVAAVVSEAGELGVRGAVIFAGGFAEAGPAGRELQDEIVTLAERHSMAIVGPNCQGLLNFISPLPLWADQVDPYKAGSVALISQSGSVATSLINNKRGVRWSHAVSSGNEACTDAADLLEYFLAVPEVNVVCAFLETIRRPRRFFELCDFARDAGKAVIVCRTGRTPAAQRAAASHSGALASPDRLVDSLLRKHHVIRTESLSELLETAKAIAGGARVAGPRVAAVTGSGGHITLLLDSAEHSRLEFPTFAETTSAKLHGARVGAGGAENPFDYWGTNNLAQDLTPALEAIADDPNIDILLGLVDFSHGPTGRGPRAARLLEAWKRAAKREDSLLVLLDAVGGTPRPEVIEQALDNDVLVLSELRTALRVLEHLAEFSTAAPPPHEPPVVPDLDGAAELLSLARPGINSGELPLRLVSAAGIPVVPTVFLARGETLPVERIDFDFPLVAKVADPALAHKAQQAGVVLGINSPLELDSAVAGLREIADGSVMIQPQLTSEFELLAGLTTSSGLGAFVVLGVGGTLTEASDDVAVRPVGLQSGDPERMLTELRAYRTMRAHSSFTKSLPAIVDAISQLDRLGRLLGDRVESLDINPLIVTANGCVAVDALLVIR